MCLYKYQNTVVTPDTHYMKVLVPPPNTTRSGIHQASKWWPFAEGSDLPADVQAFFGRVFLHDLDTWLGTPPFISHEWPFGRVTTRSLGDLLTMVINDLLTGMILQVPLPNSSQWGVLVWRLRKIPRPGSFLHMSKQCH